MNKRLFVILLLIATLLPVSAYAWDDCPFGEVNDPYPGECAKYVDTDDDGICDRSQPAPEDRDTEAPTTNEVTAIAPVKVSDEHEAIEEEHDDHDELYSVEVEGSAIKKLSIQEIADLWEIEAECLLNHTIAKFDLQKNYSIESTIDDFRDEYKFSPAQIKDIAEAIKTGDEDVLLKDFDEHAETPQVNQATSAEKDHGSLIYALLLIGLPLMLLLAYSLYQRTKK